MLLLLFGSYEDNILDKVGFLVGKTIKLLLSMSNKRELIIMPKQKTVSSAKKRFKQIGGKKKRRSFKHRVRDRNHLLSKKSQKVKRQHRKNTVIHKSDSQAIARMLGKE